MPAVKFCKETVDNTVPIRQKSSKRPENCLVVMYGSSVVLVRSHSYIPAIALGGGGADDDFGGRNNLSHPLNFSTPLRASGH